MLENILVNAIRADVDRCCAAVGRWMDRYKGAEMKLTPWFSGDQKPVRVGVYQRKNSEYEHYIPTSHFSYWDGAAWCASAHDMLLARAYSRYVSLSQNLPWRGVMK